MTAQSMRKTDLRRWNLVQISLAQKLRIANEPEAFFAFGNWFAHEVDSLGHLPRLVEARADLPR